MTLPLLDDRQFGLLVAYVLPGFLLAHGIAQQSPTLANWMAIGSDPSFGGFLYSFLIAVALGLLASTVRWMTVDRIHAAMGLRQAGWDIAEMAEHLPAIEMLVLYSYRYYQFYSNSLVVLPIWGILCFELKRDNLVVFGVLACVMATLFAGSRDTIRNYVRHGHSLRQRRVQIQVP